MALRNALGSQPRSEADAKGELAPFGEHGPHSAPTLAPIELQRGDRRAVGQAVGEAGSRARAEIRERFAGTGKLFGIRPERLDRPITLAEERKGELEEIGR